MLPPCTIVIASYNRPAQMQACLECLCQLNYPDFRIAIVDDGSTPALPSRPAVPPHMQDRVTVLRQENKGPAAARNYGVAAAQTDFIAFTDDDCRPDRDWLTHLAKAHLRAPDALIGGHVANGLPHNLCAESSQRIIDFLYRWYAETDDRLRFFAANNIAFSRQLFQKLGKLDPYFVFACEDRDLGLRWRAQGHPLIYCPQAVVRHYHDLSLAGFWRQHASYGRGARRLHLKLGGDARLNLEPLGFYTGLLTEPLRHAGGHGVTGRVAQSVLIALAQLAMTRGYAAERWSPSAPASAPPGSLTGGGTAQ